MAPRKKTKYIEASRESNMRDYTYTAYLHPTTGKLHHIQAGCRNWKTWDEAKAHYQPTAPHARWGKAWVATLDKGATHPRYAAERLEALAILYKLKWCDMIGVQEKLRLKRERVRRAKARRRK